jgi:hypothetical protein
MKKKKETISIRKNRIIILKVNFNILSLFTNALKLDFEISKDFYFDLIKKRFLSKHLIENKTNLIEEDLIENFIKTSDLSKKDKIIRNLLVLVDFLLEELDFNIKFDKSSSIYTARIKKTMLGAAKGINKHKEMHFIAIFYDIELFEYLQINPEDLLFYNKFNLVSLGKFFVNLKLEYGLFPKNYYTMLNTINIKSDLISGKINISSSRLDSLFTFMVNLFISIFY